MGFIGYSPSACHRGVTLRRYGVRSGNSSATFRLSARPLRGQFQDGFFAILPTRQTDVTRNIAGASAALLRNRPPPPSPQRGNDIRHAVQPVFSGDSGGVSGTAIPKFGYGKGKNKQKKKYPLLSSLGGQYPPISGIFTQMGVFDIGRFLPK